MSEPFCNITRAYALEMARIRAVNCRSERTVRHPIRGSAMGCSVDSILRVARHPPEAQLRGAGRRVRTASRPNIGCESSKPFIIHYLSGQAESNFLVRRVINTNRRGEPRGRTSVRILPMTSCLGSHTYVESKSFVRFCCEFLNLQHFAESAFFNSVPPNEAQMRQVLHLGNSDIQKLCYPMMGHAPPVTLGWGFGLSLVSIPILSRICAVGS